MSKISVKHTPGPWAIGLETDEIKSQIIGLDGSHIAYVECDPIQANAALIAAAPELLEACKELERCIDIAAKSKYWSHEVAQALIPARDKAATAIAKAESHE